MTRVFNRAVHHAVVVALLAGSAAAVAADEDNAAGAAAEDGGPLQEVTVTARFHRENLQQTPVAITAVTATDLEERQLGNVADLGPSIPNSFITQTPPAWGGSPAIYMRGVGQIESLFSFEPGVGIYIDDVYFSTLLGSAMDLMDLAQVEVDRGPQGTLSGKNSIGGAIRLQTQKPMGGGTGTFEATYGSFHRLDLKGSFDATLIPDTLFMRISGVSKRQDGYQTVLDFRCSMMARGTPQLAGSFPYLTPDAAAPGSNCVDGANGGTSLSAGRVQLRWLAAEKLELNFAADYSDENDGPPAVSAIYLPTNVGSPGAPGWNQDRLYANYGVYLDSRWLLSNPYQTYYQTIDPFTGARPDPNFVTRSWGYSGTADYTVTNDIHLKVIAAERGYDATNASDKDAVPLALNLVTNVDTHRQESVEFRLNGESFARTLNWTVGGFWLDTREYYGGSVTLDEDAYSGLLPPFYNNDHYTTNNKSAFLHLEQKATDRLSFSAGVRYTHEVKTFSFDHPPFLPAAGQPPITADAKLAHADWEVGADYKLTPDMFVYGTISTGARSPGFNPRPFDAAQLVPYSNEEMTSYEVGFKSDLLDHRLRFNLALFDSVYNKMVVEDSGAQQCDFAGNVSPYLGGGLCPAGTALAGAGGIPWDWFITTSGKIYGGEVELQADPIDNLEVDANFGYNHMKGDQTNPLAPDYISPDGHSIPEMNGSLGVQYRVALGRYGSLTPRLDYTLRGDYSISRVNSAPGPDDWMPSVSLFNGRLTYQPEGGKWSVSLAGTNLFNKFYWIGVIGGPPDATPMGMSGTPTQPREWSVTAKYNF